MTIVKVEVNGLVEGKKKWYLHSASTLYPSKEIITGKEQQPKDIAYDVDLKETISTGSEVVHNLNYP